MLVSLLAFLANQSLQAAASLACRQRLGQAPLSPPLTQTCPGGDCAASSLEMGTLLGYDLQVTSSPEASPSLGGEVMPCPHDAVTSFP